MLVNHAAGMLASAVAMCIGAADVGMAAPASQPASTSSGVAKKQLTYSHGGIIRGPRDRKAIALTFTGGSFGEGAPSILDELGRRHIKASFFVTGDFLRDPQHRPYLQRMIAEGHYVGPHSDKHLLYCAWEDRQRTLVTEEAFHTDLQKNIRDLVALGMPRERIRYFLPAFEWYNEQIVEWARKDGLTLVNFTPGTRSNTDYLPEADKRFIASADIFRGILDFEAAQPDGLRGFILLMHVGAGPERKDKLYSWVGRLADQLGERGYKFLSLNELVGSDVRSSGVASQAAGAAGR